MTTRTLLASSRLEPMIRWFQGFTSGPRSYLERGVHPKEKLPLRTRVMLAIYLLFRALRKSDLTTRAAATTFTFIFSLVPLLTTTLAFFTAIPSLADQRETLKNALLNYLLPGAVRNVQDYLEQFSERAAAAGTVSSLVFFISIMFLVESIEETFNRIWKAERSRTWGARFQLLALFLIVGALAATLMVTITREAAALTERARAFGFVGAADIWARIGLQAGDLVTAWAVFILANKVLPNTRVRWSSAIIGGVVAGTLWQLLKGAFTWYVGNVASYENIYGAVGTVPVLLLWIYLTFLLSLISAYLAFVTQNLRALVNTRRFEDRGQRQVAFHAVAVAATLSRAFQEREGPLSVSTLTDRLGIDPYFVVQALEPLVRAGVVIEHDVKHRIDPHCYLLAVPGDALTLGEVVRLATGEDLEVPEVEHPSAMHRTIAEVFYQARGAEGNVLERVRVADLGREPGGGSATGGDGREGQGQR